MGERGKGMIWGNLGFSARWQQKMKIKNDGAQRLMFRRQALRLGPDVEPRCWRAEQWLVILATKHQCFSVFLGGGFSSDRSRISVILTTDPLLPIGSVILM
jgi:hypothetical protein